MSRALREIKDQLGLLGLGALLALAATACFFVAAIRPLEERSARLARALEAAPRASSPELKLVAAPPGAGEMEAFRRFFERPEKTDEWLAKLYGIATARGLHLRQGEYRLADSRHGIERYQITLPVTGTYAEIRGFLNAALTEIPVLSLDQASFRRRSAGEPKIDTDLVFTLHVRRG